jgi:Co/Zn/Cd efflux system component
VTELGSEDGRLPEQLRSEAHAGGHGTKAVVVALLANLGIAVAKFVGYLVTGASSMLAEALHSVADSGNQAMLLAGGRLARRGPDPGHPFRHGRVRYFAAFLVAVVLFTLGSLFSLYEGYQKLRHPHALESPVVALAILAVGLVLEGLSLRTAVREALEGQATAGLVAACAGLRPHETARADPVHGLKAALRAVAQRIQQLDQEISLADHRLAALVGRAAPRLLKVHAIGVDHAGQLLTTAGDNSERLRGEAAFAHLCGTAPIPASSGTTHRHWLHRGGDRAADQALHLAVVVRMRWCPRTRAYAKRRSTEGLSKPDIMRCIKRYLAREVYHALVADFEALHAT